MEIGDWPPLKNEEPSQKPLSTLLRNCTSPVTCFGAAITMLVSAGYIFVKNEHNM